MKSRIPPQVRDDEREEPEAKAKGPPFFCPSQGPQAKEGQKDRREGRGQGKRAGMKVDEGVVNGGEACRHGDLLQSESQRSDDLDEAGRQAQFGRKRRLPDPGGRALGEKGEACAGCAQNEPRAAPGEERGPCPPRGKFLAPGVGIEGYQRPEEAEAGRVAQEGESVGQKSKCVIGSSGGRRPTANALDGGGKRQEKKEIPLEIQDARGPCGELDAQGMRGPPRRAYPGGIDDARAPGGGQGEGKHAGDDPKDHQGVQRMKDQRGGVVAHGRKATGPVDPK